MGWDNLFFVMAKGIIWLECENQIPRSGDVRTWKCKSSRDVYCGNGVFGRRAK